MNKLEKENQEAFEQAKKIISDYNIDVEKDIFYKFKNFEWISARFNNMDVDTRLILCVPADKFNKIAKKFKPDYIYEETGYWDDSAGHAPRKVWFITDKKVRIITSSGPGHNFYDEIVYPSNQKQLHDEMKALGNKVTWGELYKIGKKLGHIVKDDLTNNFILKIKLLSPNEAEKWKGTIFMIS